MKVGFCSLYGLANAGKSTILNAILKTKIEAVSEKPQTTRENIQGIYNDEDSQIVFVDTPGLHDPHKKLGQLMLQEAKSALYDVDAIIYVIDASKRVDKKTANRLATLDTPIILAFNKIDLIKFEQGQEKIKEYKEILPNADVVELSAINKAGIEQLVSTVKKYLQEGTPYFPHDMISDHPEEFIYSETIREKCMRLTEDEVPHACHVEIKHVEEEDNLLIIRADIIVERESEKAIMIGRQGKMISKIRRYSEEALKGFLGRPVSLDLLVKVVPDWRDNPKYLRRYGYMK